MADFKNDIMAVCEQHNKFIGHEDSYGGFIIVDGNSIDDRVKNIYREWFMDAEEE